MFSCNKNLKCRGYEGDKHGRFWNRMLLHKFDGGFARLCVKEATKFIFNVDIKMAQIPMIFSHFAVFIQPIYLEVIWKKILLVGWISKILWLRQTNFTFIPLLHLFMAYNIQVLLVLPALWKSRNFGNYFGKLMLATGKIIKLYCSPEVLWWPVGESRA